MLASAYEIAVHFSSMLCNCDDYLSQFYTGTGTTISYEITFKEYVGEVEPLVPDTSELVASSGAVVATEVVVLEEGTEPLRGDFTLRFRGQGTPALNYSATADEVRAMDAGKNLV